ncbi:hypothetical protein SLEP1_g24210 [Rubroshorea leprosula]|uniref:Uncharacterized protein n=1 Tax=Rubroshorea leprosula TaxID=152421 RepID=A0AAV5JHX5_9ROSI|nr:hypothetical protein SLEP1_g24210 [Rubroshorea leprosula]
MGSWSSLELEHSRISSNTPPPPSSPLKIGETLGGQGIKRTRENKYDHLVPTLDEYF